MQLPTEFRKRLEQIVGPDDLPSCLHWLGPKPRVAFRVNTLRSEPDMLAAQLAARGVDVERVDWMPEAFLADIANRSHLVDSDEFRGGELYLQNLSSMLATQLLAPRPDEEILDLAAAPGGKATHIAARMENRGWLSVVEPIRTRFYKLQQTLKRCGVEIAHMYRVDGRKVGGKTPNRFDRVLLDSPCSAEARIRRDDATTSAYWSRRKIGEQARKQKGLLVSAIQATKPGGTILYATCSFAPEENELVVQHAFERCGDEIEVVPIDIALANARAGLTRWLDVDLLPQLSGACRILPNAVMDGFFYCLLRKTGRSPRYRG